MVEPFEVVRANWRRKGKQLGTVGVSLARWSFFVPFVLLVSEWDAIGRRRGASLVENRSVVIPDNRGSPKLQICSKSSK